MLEGACAGTPVFVQRARDRSSRGRHFGGGGGTRVRRRLRLQGRLLQRHLPWVAGGKTIRGDCVVYLSKRSAVDRRELWVRWSSGVRLPPTGAYVRSLRYRSCFG